MTASEHEGKIIEILHNCWEFHRHCAENNIQIMAEEPSEEEILAILETGLLPDGKPVGWENDKRYWHLADEDDDR